MNHDAIQPNLAQQILIDLAIGAGVFVAILIVGSLIVLWLYRRELPKPVDELCTDENPFLGEPPSTSSVQPSSHDTDPILTDLPRSPLTAGELTRLYELRRRWVDGVASDAEDLEREALERRRILDLTGGGGRN